MTYGLVLEVALPPRSEFRRGPLVHFLQFLLRWTDLNTRINTVGSQWSGSMDVPLVEYFLLGRRVSTYEVVKGLDIWLCTVDGKGQVVVLEVKADAWKIDQGLYACPAELLRIT